MAARLKARLKNDRQGHLIAPGVSLFAVWIMALLLALSPLRPASGQAAATVVVQPPDLSTFPTLEFEFKVLDANNQPLAGYGADQVQVVENGEVRPVDALIEEYRGVHFTLAVNGDRQMDLRDEDGVSRYEKLTAALADWARGSALHGEDAWSLETNEGTLVDRTSAPRTWLNGLEGYQPNFRLMEPELTSLQNAIQSMVAEPGDFGVDQTVLYISAPPLPDQIEALNALTQMARGQGIRVDVWMVGESYFLSNDQGAALVALAADTGGQFLHYTGLEAIPDLDALHAALGRVSSLTYTSALNASGSYPLGVSVDLGGVVAEGEAQPFVVEVLPPNPMLLSPPILIERTWQGAEEEQILEPQAEALSILVQFPDGHPRALTASRLLVDGELVDINQQAPFDRFTWDLSPYEMGGTHFIRVKVEDQLGLSAETIAFPVQVVIVTPEPEPGFDWARAGLLAAAFLTGISLVMLVVWLATRFFHARKTEKPGRIPAGNEEAPSPPPTAAAQAVLATLVPSRSLLGLADPGCIPIRRIRTVLPDDLPPESPYLAAGGWEGGQVRFNFQEGGFRLQGEGLEPSVWLNGQAVGAEPLEVRPGDLVHFGKTGFRFTMNKETSSGQASVAKYEPLL